MTRDPVAAVFLAACVLCAPLPGLPAGADRDDAYREARARCLTLETLWRNWKEGLYGSRRVHERRLKDHLYVSMGHEIITDSVYCVTFEGEGGLRLYTPFRHNRWLVIEGPISGPSLKEITGGDGSKVLHWWREGPMVAARGVIRDYRLASDPGGFTVVLVLKEIELLRP